MEWLGAAGFCGLLMTALIFTGATTRIDNALYDFGLRAMRARPDPSIVIVAVDDATLRQEGDWPWPRRRLASLIRAIGQAKPRAVGWYFVFGAKTDYADDLAVHDAMQGTPTYVSRPTRLLLGPGGRQSQLLASSAAVGAGVVDAEGDEDGIVRKTYLFEGPNKGDPRPRVALQLARLLDRGPRRAPRDIQPTDVSGTIFHGGRILIPYVGPPGSFRTVSAWRVMAGHVAPSEFRDKIVLVGATAPSLLDNYPTPVSRERGMPDVEVDANILNALLTGRRIWPSPPIVTLLASLALILGLLFALVRLRPSQTLPIAASMILLALAGSLAALVAANLWMPPIPFVIAEAVIVPYWGWRRLNAASAFLGEELRALARSVGQDVVDGSGSVRDSRGDMVLRQMSLLRAAKTRISDLSRFVADILANFPDPVLVVNRQGLIQNGNQAAADLGRALGIPVAIGSRIEPLLQRVAPSAPGGGVAWPPPDESSASGPLQSEQPSFTVGPGGRAYEARFTPTRSAEGAASGWIVHLADVTPLVSALRQREEALHLLSHDMRSPQSAILATLSHPDFATAPPTLRQRIETHARSTLDLADAFVRLARAEAARYDLEPIDLAHVAQDAADAVWPLAQAAGVQIDFDLPDIEFVVLADRSLVTRAIVNLLDNAVKFSPRGETVSMRLASASMDAREAVELQIADHAGGMDDVDIANLFKRFSRSRDSRRGPGLGLGLSMVHTVVTRHDGVISCRRADGGTVFTITLPLHEEEGGLPSAPTPANEHETPPPADRRAAIA